MHTQSKREREPEERECLVHFLFLRSLLAVAAPVKRRFITERQRRSEREIIIPVPRPAGVGERNRRGGKRHIDAHPEGIHPLRETRSRGLGEREIGRCPASQSRQPRSVHLLKGTTDVTIEHALANAPSELLRRSGCTLPTSVTRPSEWASLAAMCSTCCSRNAIFCSR